MTPRRFAGLVVGIAGVGALVGLQVGSIDLTAVGEVLVVAVGYALGPIVLFRKLADLPSVAVVAVSVSITAAVYAPFALARPPHHVEAKAVWSVVGLAVICTALAFLVFFALIAEIGPTRATVITYVNPAVAIVLGATVLSEKLTTGMLVGFPLVIVGSVLATSREKAASPAELIPTPG